MYSKATLILSSVLCLAVGAFVGNAVSTKPSVPSSGMHSALTAMNAELEGKTGDAFDRAFVAEMIVHHQGAIEMAEAALERAQRAEVKELAKNIIQAQTSEIDLMKRWQAEWK